MIRISYDTLQRNPYFGMAMQKLVSTPCEQKLAYALKKINDAMSKGKKQIIDEYRRDILDVYAVKDEKGDIKVKEDNEEEFVCQEGKQTELEGVSQKFWEREVTIDRAKIPLGDLASIKLTAIEL